MIFLEGDNGGGSGGGEGSATATTLLGGAAPGSSQQINSGASGVPVNGEAKPWHAALPDTYRTTPSLTAFTGFESKDLIPVPREMVEKLGASYQETKAMVGKKLEMPGEGATAEQLASWRKTVGAPETPEGYIPEGAKSLRPDTIPETMWDPASEKKFLEIAHKHSLPPAAVKDIMSYYGENLAAGIKASETGFAEHTKAEQAVLRNEWGKDFDKNNNDAARMMQTLGLPIDRLPTISEYGKAMAKGVKLFSEDKLIKGEFSGGINGSIHERIRDIQDSKSTSVLAREYRGEFGTERALSAQKQLHELMTAAQVPA